MTTSTFYASTADGQIESSNATYATARSGGTLVANTGGTSVNVGQVTGYACYEAFLSFDTSTIPDGDIITSVTLSLDGTGATDGSDTDFTINARIYNWGAGLTTADWIAGASLSGNTLVASRSTSGWSASGYNALTSEAAFLTAINKTGVTYLVISSSRHEAGTAPTGNEYVGFATAEASGTTHDPKLVVTHVAPTGTVASSIQPLTAALAGEQVTGGPIAVSLQPLTAALTGWHEAFGTITASLQPLTAALGGRAYFPEIEGVPRPATSKVARSGSGTARIMRRGHGAGR